MREEEDWLILEKKLTLNAPKKELSVINTKRYQDL
jgi:hypothetical protein